MLTNKSIKLGSGYQLSKVLEKIHNNAHCCSVHFLLNKRKNYEIYLLILFSLLISHINQNASNYQIRKWGL